MPIPSLPITGNVPVTTSETWPANRVYTFAPGAKLQVAAGVVLTIKGRVEAGRTQIFEPQSAPTLPDGKVVGIAEVIPEWWGAVGDGVADDTAAVQAAVDCISAAEGSASAGGRARVVLQSHGRYLCTSTIELKPSSAASLSIVGAGTELDGSRLIAGTAVSPNPPFTGPLVRIAPITLGSNIGNGVDVELANFGLVRSTSVVETGLELVGPGAGQAYNRVDNLFVDDFKIGVRVDKIRLWHFTDCYISSQPAPGARAVLIEDGGGSCGDLQFTASILQVKGETTPAGSAVVRIQNTTEGTELKGIRFSDCVFYGGAVGLDLYSTREIGDIYVSTGCQFDYAAPGVRIQGTAEGTGAIENIQITGVDFRSTDAPVIPVRFEKATDAKLRDIGVTDCRFTSFDRAVYLQGVEGAVVSNNRLYAVGGHSGGNVDWAIAFADCTSFSAIGNVGHNSSSDVLQHGVMVVGASDYFTVIGNAFKGLTTTTAVVDGSSGTHKQVSLNTP